MTNSPRDQLNTATPTDEEQSENKLCPGHGVVVDDLPGAHTDDYLIALTQVTATMTLNDVTILPDVIGVPFEAVRVPVFVRVDMGLDHQDGDKLGCREEPAPHHKFSTGRAADAMPAPSALHLHIKALVAEAVARRASVVGPCVADADPNRTRGPPSTPPWERAARCPAGCSASDVVLRALLKAPEAAKKSKGRGRARPAYLAYPRAGPGAGLRQQWPWGRRRPSTAPPEPTDFDYVVREQEQARVAFGSAQSRAVMPLAGLKGGASRLANLALRTTDALRDLGPAAYHAANLGALYDVLHKKRGRVVKVRSVRRPGSYSPGAFNLPGVPVAVRCGAGEGPGRCEGCLQELPAGVEFWALDAAVQGLARGCVLCQACMLGARRQPRDLARYTRWQLDAFRKTRDCSDIHRHEGTKAKILLVDPKTVAKRRRKEAYLAKYFRDHTVVDPDFMPGTEPAKLTEGEQARGVPRKDDFCCLHEAFNSFNKDHMSFGLRLPSDLIYNTMKRCALDFHPSLSSSLRTTTERSSSLKSDGRRRSGGSRALHSLKSSGATQSEHGGASTADQSRRESTTHVTGREGESPPRT
ncbi:hypothetical protein FOCC_FOCC003594 [Frankliniella occidentalis]|nr:hypothetical protein FOCC_FOCC003594 [Frankliniella occidentalis]